MRKREEKRAEKEWRYQEIRERKKKENRYDKQTYVPEVGTPQGGILSPLLSNIYLNELDQYMERLYLEK